MYAPRVLSTYIRFDGRIQISLDFVEYETIETSPSRHVRRRT